MKFALGKGTFGGTYHSKTEQKGSDFGETHTHSGPRERPTPRVRLTGITLTVKKTAGTGKVMITRC